jgi:hypothetical protein
MATSPSSTRSPTRSLTVRECKCPWSPTMQSNPPLLWRPSGPRWSAVVREPTPITQNRIHRRAAHVRSMLHLRLSASICGSNRSAFALSPAFDPQILAEARRSEENAVSRPMANAKRREHRRGAASNACAPGCSLPTTRCPPFAVQTRMLERANQTADN